MSEIRPQMTPNLKFYPKLLFFFLEMIFNFCWTFWAISSENLIKIRFLKNYFSKKRIFFKFDLIWPQVTSGKIEGQHSSWYHESFKMTYFDDSSLHESSRTSFSDKIFNLTSFDPHLTLSHKKSFAHLVNEHSFRCI